MLRGTHVILLAALLVLLTITTSIGITSHHRHIYLSSNDSNSRSLDINTALKSIMTYQYHTRNATKLDGNILQGEWYRSCRSSGVEANGAGGGGNDEDMEQPGIGIGVEGNGEGGGSEGDADDTNLIQLRTTRNRTILDQRVTMKTSLELILVKSMQTINLSPWATTSRMGKMMMRNRR